MSHAQIHMTTYYPPTVTVEVREDFMFVELAHEDGAFTTRAVISGPPEDVAALCREIANHAEYMARGPEPDPEVAAADTGALA